MDKKVEGSVGNSIKIAILGNFTLSEIRDVLDAKCTQCGFKLDYYEGSYNQYQRDLLTTRSGLYSFNPDFTILFLDIQSLFGDVYFSPYRMNEKTRRVFIRKKVRELTQLVTVFKNNCHGKLLIHNFSVPTYSPLGILENVQPFGFFEMVEYLNRKLSKFFQLDSQVFIYDYNSFLNRHGKMQAVDPKMYYIADLRLKRQLIPLLCDDYLRYINAIKGRARKCIILDLDNTLWGRVLGEDGIEGIQLGTTAPGNAYLEFQKYLLSLHERGIILAINSQNNAEDVQKVFEEHPYMILKENNFASLQINWENKVIKLDNISKELNLGLDSFIFIDDDPVQRAWVRKIRPEVFVPEWPSDPAHYVRALQGIKELETIQITEEDRNRGVLYAQERQRRLAKAAVLDTLEFLRSLNLKIEIQPINNFNLPRISQLTLRTNQFNMTTRRYSEDELHRLIANQDTEIYAALIKDRFGDYGMTGALFLKEDKEALVVNNFILSCRVLGKDIETALLAFIIQYAEKNRMKKILIKLIPTKKNIPAQHFLAQAQFKKIMQENETEIWCLDVKKGPFYPKHIEVIVCKD